MKTKSFFISLLAAILAGSSYFFALYYPEKKNRQIEDQLIQAVIEKLRVDELAGQLMHIAIPGTELTDQNKAILHSIKPGGIIFFGYNLKNAAQITKFTRDLQSYAHKLNLPPLLISTDQEGGYVKRVRDGVLQIPSALTLGETGNPALCESAGFFVSRDLKTMGINVFFAPVLDINNNPENPIIGKRSFGATITSVETCGLAFEKGARAGGSIPVMKHFPGHGDTHIDSHIGLPVIEKDLNSLKTFELHPFRSAIETGARAMMSAHILFPKIDPKYPVTLSHHWLTEILRTDLKYSGVLFTDAMEMKAVSEHYKSLNLPRTALEAGADILLYTSWQEEVQKAHKLVVEFVESGEFKMHLRAKLVRQLRFKLPEIDPTRYLNAADSKWYLDYRAKQTSPRNWYGGHQAPYEAAIPAKDLVKRALIESVKWRERPPAVIMENISCAEIQVHSILKKSAKLSCGKSILITDLKVPPSGKYDAVIQLTHQSPWKKHRSAPRLYPLQLYETDEMATNAALEALQNPNQIRDFQLPTSD